jgi:phenylalanyl-tRNA synthetase alpha chain
MCKIHDVIKNLKSAVTLDEVEKLKTQLLGSNGLITQAMQELSQLPIEVRKVRGKELNELKKMAEEIINIKRIECARVDVASKIDFTIPQQVQVGVRHPITRSIQILKRFFSQHGFVFANGLDIEDVYHNFEALNIPKNHPAMSNSDTFYISNEKLLRTHTTTVQIRLLEQLQDVDQDIRSYSIGRVFRNDAHDATHACSFYQIEGVVIEKNATLSHLKTFLEELCKTFFEKEVIVVFRPSYFPFTSPSCEADAIIEGRTLELGGCGIIHPDILQRFNMRHRNGFAFGFGLERLISIKYDLTSIHDLYNNHIPTIQYIAQCY